MDAELISRRDFIKHLVMAGASVTTLVGCASSREQIQFQTGQSKDTSKSTVVIARSESLSKPKQALIKDILNAAIARLYGLDSGDKAWKMLFNPNDTVGIKVNCISSMIPTHPELAYAIAECILSAGVPEEQIIIWDRDDRELVSSGYSINLNNKGIRCYGTKPNFGYSEELTVFGSIGTRISKIVSRQCTAVVNAPVLKDHNIAGMTFALKNYYGAIVNPNKFHSNNCDPYVADLNNIPQIKEKTKLIVGDAIKVLYDGGPTGYKEKFSARCNSIIIGNDPVAVDQIGLMLIEECRSKAGLPSLADVGRPVRYLDTASNNSLGVRDPQKIKVIELIF